MKVKNKQILEIEQSLMYLTSKETIVWYELFKNTNLIKPIIAEINDARKLILDKYSKRDKDGNLIFLDEKKTEVDFGSNLEQSIKDWEKVLLDEKDIDFVKISIESLKDIKLTSFNLVSLIDVILEN